LRAFKIPMATASLVAAGIITGMFGPGLPTASAVPTEDQLIEISKRSVPETCDALRNLPTAQGVKGAVADVQSQTKLPKWAAERVVGHAVRQACPERLGLVQQVVPNFP